MLLFVVKSFSLGQAVESAVEFGWVVEIVEVVVIVVVVVDDGLDSS